MQLPDISQDTQLLGLANATSILIGNQLVKPSITSNYYYRKSCIG